jgi:hypothetical protein
MASSDLVPVGSGEYVARVTPLKGRSDRSDVEVEAVDDVEAFARNDIVARLREFFADLEGEAQQHAWDPVALSHALARMEALLADVRYVRDTIRDLDARALHAAKVRRLTISGVVTVEGTSELSRTGWRHAELLHAMLSRQFGGETLVVADTGETVDLGAVTDLLLSWFTPSWRLTPIREAGLNPDRFCEVLVDDDGKPVREPAVKMVDNLIRRPT